MIKKFKFFRKSDDQDEDEHEVVETRQVILGENEDDYAILNPESRKKEYEDTSETELTRRINATKTIKEVKIIMNQNKELVKDTEFFGSEMDILNKLDDDFKPSYSNEIINVKEHPTVIDIRNYKVFVKTKNDITNLIRGIDIKIHKGEILGLVGESGVGKSVLIRTLLNTMKGVETSADKSDLDGVDLSKITDYSKVRGSKISFIPQDPENTLNPTKKIHNQFCEIYHKFRKELKTSNEKKHETLKLLEEFGVKHFMDVMKKYPHELDKTTKQRIMIALAVASHPSVIIADSPAKALDSTQQLSILKLLWGIKEKYKISIIFVSHNIAVLSKFADYIYVMYAGAIVEKGTRSDIFTNPKHPYTWALIGSVPEINSSEGMFSIPGSPPPIGNLPVGDPFSSRNEYALKIDFTKEPELMPISETHWAATWLVHPSAPRIDVPLVVQKKINKYKTIIDKQEVKQYNINESQALIDVMLQEEKKTMEILLAKEENKANEIKLSTDSDKTDK